MNENDVLTQIQAFFSTGTKGLLDSHFCEESIDKVTVLRVTESHLQEVVRYTASLYLVLLLACSTSTRY